MKSETEGRSVGWAWAIEYAPILILVGISVSLLVVVVLGRRLDRRLDSIENNLSERLRYTEPKARTDSEADPISTSDDIGQGRFSYVPAHSHVYAGEGDAILLTVTLSIRNTDRRSPLRLLSAQYIDTKGKRLREFVTKPTEVAPLETLEFLVGESDFEGGSGASFVVQWNVAEGANEPLIEAVMIGSAGGQGISFVQRAIELDSRHPSE